MISCELYDYVEIACLNHQTVELKLRDGSLISGIATDTCRNIDGNECMAIKLSVSGNMMERIVEIDNLVSMRATQANPHFHLVTFE